ncbi:MAG TPA: GntR family transcriptional regulator [Rhodocyclaceae bacterium]|nr:GntR family transcriptional regulator [Rhodocyclaceae bacterium]
MADREPVELKLREQVVLKLRELILGGELAAGQRVAEIPISERLGVSRTPVRQALTVLAQEGLLSTAGKRGYVVHAFSAKDILDAIEVRGILEGAAARLTAEAGPSPDLMQALEACLAEGAVITTQEHYGLDDDVRWVEVNGRFHKLIVEASANTALISALALNDKRPFASAQAVLGGDAPSRLIARRHHEVLLRAQGEHQRIVEALRLRQGARLQSLMQEHARLAQANVALFRPA